MTHNRMHKIKTKYLVSLAKTTYIRNKILVCAHKHETLTMLSLTAGNVSSALCSTILEILVARECRIFCNIETCLSPDKYIVGFTGISLQES
jgi:hypothetical protein